MRSNLSNKSQVQHNAFGFKDSIGFERVGFRVVTRVKKESSDNLLRKDEEKPGSNP